jgi:hypothetical protein
MAIGYNFFASNFFIKIRPKFSSRNTRMDDQTDEICPILRWAPKQMVMWLNLSPVTFLLLLAIINMLQNVVYPIISWGKVYYLNTLSKLNLTDITSKFRAVMFLIADSQ